jgi:hypothetical protein
MKYRHKIKPPLMEHNLAPMLGAYYLVYTYTVS